MGLTLVVLAAGIGKRFGGGIKQLTPIGPNGELIIDYSIYDALQAGFTDVVFIVREEIEKQVRKSIGDRIASIIGSEHVLYVHQELSAIPKDIKLGDVKEFREKPWGTAHAILMCRGCIDQPFAVINADDYYGKDAYCLVADFLKKNPSDGDYCMAGYILKNTLSRYGTVTRGICTLDSDSNLTEVNETRNIITTDNGASSNGIELNVDSVVSMNFWGFMPRFLDTLESEFRSFLKTASLEKDEFLLPELIDKQIKSGRSAVKCLKTSDNWFGVTYAADKEIAARSIMELVHNGIYPEKLWGTNNE